MLKSAEPSAIDLQKRYNLIELFDIAQHLNPETRVAWEAARETAIAVGLVESEYFPVLFVTPGYNRSVPAPLKNAIDVGSRPYGKSVWDGKPGAVVSVSPGCSPGLFSSRQRWGGWKR